MVINGIGNLIEAYRKENNLTDTRISKQIGIDRKTLYTIKDTDDVVKTETLNLICKILGITIVMNGDKITQSNSINGNNNIQANVQQIASLEYIKSLEQRIKDLEKRLEDKEMIINLLTKK